MQIDNRFLDDFARVASGALGLAARIKDELAVTLRQQLDNVLGGIELVTREEFEAVKDMAAKARAEQEVLAERLAALEARSGKDRPKRSHKAGDPDA
jgi:BMFP domain-containing protein YqiC